MQGNAAFYRIREGQITPIAMEEISTPGSLIAYLSMEDFRLYSQRLGIDAGAINEWTSDGNRLRNSVDVFDVWSLGVINVVNLQDLAGDRDRLLFIVMKDRFILVKVEDRDDSVRQLFDAAVQRSQKNATLEKFVFSVLERFLQGGGKMLEQLDNQMLRMEGHLVNGSVRKELNRTIYALRQQLMLAHNYFEQLIDIGEELHENENELFNPDNLHYFRMFVGRAERLSNATQLKSDNLVHLREALDAELNYKLNSIMKIFTVLTAIFAPLTLIVGWYGMNFKHMPELGWPWAYPALFVLCVMLTAVILMIFRRKRLM